MRCSNCNREIENGVAFCTYCGTVIKRDEKKIKMVALNCPNCSAELEVEDGLDIFFCKYCGSKIMLGGQSDAAYRAKTRIKGMEHDERMADKKYAHEKYKIEQKTKSENVKVKRTILIVAAIVIAYVVLFAGVFGSAERKSKQIEEELQELVDEIMVDIENEDFDEAYIKAQSIKHTEPWSDEVEEKWENTRKEVINQIIEAEKEATGSSTHKPEGDGWLDGLFD